MGERIGLQKVRAIEFARVGDNEFVAYFLDNEGTPVSVLDNREIFEGETYKIDFSYDIVVSVPRFEESLDKLL